MKKHLQTLVFLSFFLSFHSVLSLRAEPVASKESVFSEANKKYETSQFAEAMEKYQALYRQGYGGASLYYNLGNTAFKLGNRGWAVLWYERAQRLKPRDADIHFNLALAKSQLREEKDSFLTRLVWFLSHQELRWTVTVLTWIFFLMLGLQITKRYSSAGINVTLWASGVFLFIAGVWLAVQFVWINTPNGVVVSPPGEVRNGPGQEYAVGFTLPEGTAVLILNRRPEWIEVGIPQQGLKGWIPAKEIEPISWPAASS